MYLPFTIVSPQVGEVMVAARLDPSLLQAVNARLDEVLESRNNIIRQLQQSVSLVVKAHNDTVRVFEARLRDLGIPSDVGSDPDALLIPSPTSLGPAQLVAKPA
jgi:hypothetical protein